MERCTLNPACAAARNARTIVHNQRWSQRAGDTFEIVVCRRWRRPESQELVISYPALVALCLLWQVSTNRTKY